MLNKKNELNLLNEFSNTWSIERIKEMSLEEYTDYGNKDTFCYWLEIRLHELGSIRGATSYKFGIYKRKKDNTPSGYMHDETYSWVKKFGKTRIEAFNNVKLNILKVIEATFSEDYIQIDKNSLSHMFKWKIAYLFSNGRTFPVYSKDKLKDIMREFKKKFDYTSKIQEFLIETKPIEITSLEFAHNLYFGNNDPSKNKAKSENNYERKTKEHTTQINPIHSKIQNKLVTQLEKEYGINNVKPECNYIDIKVETSKLIKIYEIKTAPTAYQCYRQALGQILDYTYKVEEKTINKSIELIIVGPYSETNKDKSFFEFINNKINLNISYQHISIPM